MATLLTAAALVASTGSVPAQAEPEPAPVLSLVVPDKLTAYGNGNRVFTDLGIVLENTGGPFELWMTRGEPGSEGRYDQDILATTRDSEGHETGSLDAAAGATMNGLQDMVTVRAKPRAGGKAIRFGSGTSCLGGEGSQRIRPEGPAVSPYPEYCFGGYNNFTLGNVQGIPGGWGSPLFEYYGALRIPHGRYDVTVTMDDTVADALGVPTEERSQTMVLKVASYRDGGFRGGDGGSAGEGSPGVTLAPSGLQRRDEVEEPPAGYPLPDLAALPAFGFRIPTNGNFLQFSATVWNAGNTPLVVDGFRRDGEDVMDGYQYYFDEDGEQLPEYTGVGEFEWDPKPTHQHWHFRSFARYSLVEHGAPVVPDESDHHSVSRKEAFCLANTDAVDLTGDGAAWKVENTDLSTACGDYGSRSIREVLDAGWGDTYAQFRAGQSFNLKKIPNGCYDIVVEGNPVLDTASGERTLFEDDSDGYANNVSRRTVKIMGKPGARTLQYTSVGIVERGFIKGERRDVVTPEDLGCEPHDH